VLRAKTRPGRKSAAARVSLLAFGPAAGPVAPAAFPVALMAKISRDELKTILTFGVHIAKLDRNFDVWERKILARFAAAMKLTDQERESLAKAQLSLSKGLQSLDTDDSRQLLVKVLCAVAHVDGKANEDELEFIQKVAMRMKGQVFVLPREDWGRYEGEVFSTLDALAKTG
jgi:tellurite resistance protein